MDNSVYVEKHLLIYAMRYSMGQTTSAPIQVMDALRKNLNAFTEMEIEIFIQEIKYKRKKKNLGTEFDKRNWNIFQSELESCLHRRRKERMENGKFEEIE